jgi:hypothetical protein
MESPTRDEGGTMSDALRDIIRRSVMGESELWPIDPHFPAVGSFEDRFNAGDKQILLWAIDDYAQRGEPAPQWAAKELNNITYSAAQGKYTSWNDAFGKIFAGIQRRRAQTLTRMLDVYPIDNRLFERVGQELKLPASGKTTVQELYLRVKADVERQSK